MTLYLTDIEGGFKIKKKNPHTRVSILFIIIVYEQHVYCHAN